MRSQQGKIKFHYLTPTSIPNRTALKAFVLTLFDRERRQVHLINYIFCDDDYLLELNQKHLAHDTLTDIITFELNERSAPILSDIYISTERVKENAREFGVSFQNELLRVVIHGALHLCGYRDKTQKEQKVMREKETFYMNGFTVSRETTP
jgi:rRNA maturation RNase YbeY